MKELTLSDEEWERECSIHAAAYDDAFVAVVKALGLLTLLASIGGLVLWL